MPLRMRVHDREPIQAALRRFKNHVRSNRNLIPPHKQHFVRNTAIRRAKEFWKRVLSRAETKRAKEQGLQ